MTLLLAPILSPSPSPNPNPNPKPNPNANQVKRFGMVELDDEDELDEAQYFTIFKKIYRGMVTEYDEEEAVSSVREVPRTRTLTRTRTRARTLPTPCSCPNSSRSRSRSSNPNPNPNPNPNLQDWEHDSCGQHALTREMFFDCVFELADVWSTA